MDGLIFLYLILFPFGKLLGIIPDLVILFLLILNLKKIRLNNFLMVCIFSLLFSLSFFSFPQIFTGILYLIRLVAYFIFSQIIYRQFGQIKRKRDRIFNSLIFIGIVIAVLGWIQYLFIPDLRHLKNFGWDDHYFRLASTFLDPAFTGILLVLTEILILVRTLQNKTKFNFFLNIFLVVTILFTYSRASFLALFIVLIFFIIKFRKKFLIILLMLFIPLIFVLPKAASEGTNLSRTYSIGQKLVNYEESINLIKISPVFGLGFDNLCAAKQKFLHEGNLKSHTCSGLDNSILFIVATTGIVSFMVFVSMIWQIIKNTKLDLYGWGLMASFIAIFVHGMFTETFFYSFVMGWIAILVGITRKKSDKMSE